MVVTSLVWLSSHWYYCQDIGIVVICIIVKSLIWLSSHLYYYQDIGIAVICINNIIVKSLIWLSSHWYYCQDIGIVVICIIIKSFIWLSSHCYTAILGEIEPHLSGYYTDKGVLMNKSVESLSDGDECMTGSSSHTLWILRTDINFETVSEPWLFS